MVKVNEREANEKCDTKNVKGKNIICTTISDPHTQNTHVKKRNTASSKFLENTYSYGKTIHTEPLSTAFRN